MPRLCIGRAGLVAAGHIDLARRAVARQLAGRVIGEAAGDVVIGRRSGGRAVDVVLGRRAEPPEAVVDVLRERARGIGLGHVPSERIERHRGVEVDVVATGPRDLIDAHVGDPAQGVVRRSRDHRFVGPADGARGDDRGDHPTLAVVGGLGRCPGPLPDAGHLREHRHL